MANFQMLNTVRAHTLVFQWKPVLYDLLKFQVLIKFWSSFDQVRSSHLACPFPLTKMVPSENVIEKEFCGTIFLTNEQLTYHYRKVNSGWVGGELE